MQSKEIPLNSVLERYAGIPVLILGASGFIGRWVARLLTRAGADLYLPARDCASAKKTFVEYGVDGSIYKTDLRDFDALRRLILELNPSITFNLAGYGIDRSESSEELAYKINSQLPELICSIASKCAPADTWTGQRFVHAGTAMEYGDVGGDLNESSATRPTTLYGRSKLAGTKAVASICQNNSFAGVTARLFAVYGPGESPTRLLPTLAAASRQTGPIDLTAGLHKRDFTYVEDVSEALIRLSLSECQKGEVVNVATGTLTSIRTFVQTASRDLGIGDDRLNFGALNTRPEEMNHDPVNCDRLLELTGCQPGTGLHDGIRKTLAFRQSDRVALSGEQRSRTVCELF